MKRAWVLLGVLAVLAAAALVGGRWLMARHDREEGLRLARAGRFAEARPLLESALARRENDVEVVAELALGALAGGTDEAAGHLSRWCELSPHEARPYRLRMGLRHRQAREAQARAERQRLFELAVADGQRAVELEPEGDETQRELVLLLLNVNRHAAAEELCRRCLARAPEDGWLTFLLARARHGQGDRAGAEALLDAVVAAQPGHPEPLLLRATLHREAGQPARAIPLLRQALALERAPRKACLYQLGLALAGAGQEAEARRVMAELDIENIQETLTRGQYPNTPSLRLQLAEATLAAGKTDEARALLLALLKDDPNHAAAKRLLATLDKEKK